MSFYSELKRRNVIKVAIAYSASAWVIAQVADLVLENVGGPEWTVKAILVVMLIGFPVALIFSWAYEITPEGIRLDTPEDSESEAAVPSPPRSTKRLAIAWTSGMFVIVSLGAVVALNVGGLRDWMIGAVMEPITSIAVLPLDNLSGDPEQEYFTDGMTEALTAELAQINTLKVISRTSAMRFKNTDKLLPEIARELGVDALLEGSVLRAGDEVRITLQLVHGPTDRHLWARSFERNLRDILALQGEVARAIAEEMRITLTPSLREKLQASAEAKIQDSQAYDIYLKGRYQFNLGIMAFQKALDYYEEAIAIDPEFALAYAALSEVCLQPPILFSGTRTLDDCEAAALKAIELNSELADAHAALGLTRLMQWDWGGSEEEFALAISINPSSVMAHQWYAEVLRVQMRYDEAVIEITKAEELDPLNLFIKSMVGWPLYSQGRFDEALAQFNEVLEMDPNFGLALFNQGLVYSMMGLTEEVQTSARRVGEVMGENSLPGRYLAIVGYALAGDEDKAMEALSEIEQNFAKFSAGTIATIYLLLGQEDEALDALEKGYEIRSIDIPVSTSESAFDVLRDHPRFKELRRKIGLP